MPELPDLHPEHAEIEAAAALHAAYYRMLVWEHGIHPDNATALTQTFMEMSLDRDSDD